MERRRVFAWAGSITLTAAVSALILGSHFGGFGLGPPPAQQPRATSVRPTPGGTGVGPTPAGPGVGATPVGAGAQPAGPGAGRASGSGPAVQPTVRSPAAGGTLPAHAAPGTMTTVGSNAGPPRDLAGPATGAGGARALAPKPTSVRPRDVMIGNPPQPRSLEQPGSREQSAVRTAVQIATFEAWRAQLIASALGHSPGGDPRTVAGKPAGQDRGNDG